MSDAPDASFATRPDRRWRDQLAQAATPVASWEAFAARAPRAGFRNLYGAEPVAQAWNITRPGEAMRVPEPAAREDDPLEQAAQAGFVQGFHEGERLAREALEADNAARLTLAAALDQLVLADEGTLASLLSQAVLRLVRQIMGHVPIDEAALAERCAAVAACIDGEAAQAVLEVHPDDLPLLAAEQRAIRLSANPALPRGTVCLATADGWVEDGPDIRFARLQALLNDLEGRA